MANNKLFTLLWPTNKGVYFANILRAYFCTKGFCLIFMCLQLYVGLYFLWKEISKKVAYKMLVKLTIGVNFIIISWAAILHERVLHSLYVLTVWVGSFVAKENQLKI